MRKLKWLVLGVSVALGVVASSLLVEAHPGTGGCKAVTGGDPNVICGKITGAPGSFTSNDCSTALEGSLWWDTTDTQWEVCNANTGAPLVVGAATGGVTSVGGCTGPVCDGSTAPLSLDFSAGAVGTVAAKAFVGPTAAAGQVGEVRLGEAERITFSETEASIPDVEIKSVIVGGLKDILDLASTSAFAVYTAPLLAWGNLTSHTTAPTNYLSDTDFPVSGSGNVRLWANCAFDNDCAWQISSENGTAGTRIGMITVVKEDTTDAVLWLGSAVEAENTTTGIFTPAAGISVSAIGELKPVGTTASIGLPAQTGPTLDAAGEIAVDTTNASTRGGQLQYHDGTAIRAVTPFEVENWVIETPVDADSFLTMKAIYAMKLLRVDCIVTGATSISAAVQECTSSGGSCADSHTPVVCTTTGANTETFSDDTLETGDWLKLDFSALSGTPTQVAVTLTYRWEPQ